MLSKRVINCIGKGVASRFYAVSNIPRLGMNIEIPGYGSFAASHNRRIPKLKVASDLKKPETISTKLPNGLTVVTRETYEAVEDCVNY